MLDLCPIESCALRFSEQRNVTNRNEIIKHPCVLSHSVFALCLNNLRTYTVHRVREVKLADTLSMQLCVRFVYNIARYYILMYNNYKT